LKTIDFKPIRRPAAEPNLAALTAEKKRTVLGSARGSVFFYLEMSKILFSKSLYVHVTISRGTTEFAYPIHPRAYSSFSLTSCSKDFLAACVIRLPSVAILVSSVAMSVGFFFFLCKIDSFDNCLVLDTDNGRVLSQSFCDCAFWCYHGVFNSLSFENPSMNIFMWFPYTCSNIAVYSTLICMVLAPFVILPKVKSRVTFVFTLNGAWLCRFDFSVVYSVVLVKIGDGVFVFSTYSS
jgi:hypothetical protein